MTKDDSMLAMVFRKKGNALEEERRPRPRPGSGEVLLRVRACAVCRTDLHVFDGDLKDPELPLILGHQIVATVEELGADVDSLELGDRVGIPWLGGVCGECRYCRSGRENLCGKARFTGYHVDGGYAEFTLADPSFSLALPPELSDHQAAPMLCAGLIGYRSLKMTGDARRLGLYGFGAAGHLVAQVAAWEGRQVFAFTRPGDESGQRFARRLGAAWAGGSDTMPPQELDAAIVFAPVGSLVPEALRAVARGGRVVCAGIHMSDIPAFPYELLWGERTLQSVANLTRQDGIDFFEVAPQAKVRCEVAPYPLKEANQALQDLRDGRLEGAAVLDVG